MISGGERFSLDSLARLVRSWLPKYCLICHSVDKRQICRDCFSAELTRIERPCGNCGKPLMSDRLDGMCGNCGEMDLRWQSAHSLFAYTEPSRDFLHAAKYYDQARALEDLLDLVELSAPRGLDRRELIGMDPLELDGLVPVPMHWKRGMGRGYNQARVIAEWLSRRINVPVLEDVAVKTRETENQAGLSRNQRLENLRGAFALGEAEAELPENCALAVIDDLVTTGATMSEVCKTLGRSDRIDYLHIFSVFTTDLRFN